MLERLKKRADFLQVARRGISIPAKYFILQVFYKGGVGGVRVGFTASRRIGGAVVRNRAKRRLRALASSFLKPFAHCALDIVLIARKSTASCPYQKLEEDALLFRSQIEKIIEKSEK